MTSSIDDNVGSLACDLVDDDCDDDDSIDLLAIAQLKKRQRELEVSQPQAQLAAEKALRKEKRLAANKLQIEALQRTVADLEKKEALAAQVNLKNIKDVKNDYKIKSKQKQLEFQ